MLRPNRNTYLGRLMLKTCLTLWAKSKSDSLDAFIINTFLKRKNESKTQYELTLLKHGYKNIDIEELEIENFDKYIKEEFNNTVNTNIIKNLRLYGFETPLNKTSENNYSREDLSGRILKFIRKELKIAEDEKIYAHWLTTATGIKNFQYSDDAVVAKYNIPPRFMIISDLDQKGILCISRYKFKEEIVWRLYEGEEYGN
jgi:hypothetical protein